MNVTDNEEQEERDDVLWCGTLRRVQYLIIFSWVLQVLELFPTNFMEVNTATFTAH